MIWNDNYLLIIGIILILYAFISRQLGIIISAKNFKIAKKKAKHEYDEDFTYSFALYIGLGVFFLVLYYFARIGFLY